MSTFPLTTIAAGTQQPAQPLNGGTTGLFANIEGMNFFDVILSRILADAAGEQKTNPALSGQAESTNAAKAKADLKSFQNNNPLTLLQIALASQQTDENGNILVTPLDKAPQDIQNQLNLTNTIINHLQNVLPQSAEQSGIFKTLLSKLQSRSDTLETSLKTLETGVISKDTPVDSLPLPLLIAFGLSPSEISAVSDKIFELEEKLGREITVEDLIAGVGGLIPPSPENGVLTLNSNGLVRKISSAAENPASPDDIIDALDGTTQPTDELAAQLNALDVGGEGAGDGIEAVLPSTRNKEQDSLQNISADLPPSEETLNSAPKSLEGKPDFNGPSKDGVLSKPSTGSGTPSSFDPFAFTPGPSAWVTEEGMLQPFGLSSSSHMTFGSSAQAANLIATPATAGQAHPASQFVAATLNKFVQNAQGDQSMTLRLDPPELGNINVQLKFGKDKSIKAHLIVERPETYVMLQRDGQTLERALQQAGFESSDQSLSFELAQDNSAFEDSPFKGGSQNGDISSGTSSKEQEADVIDTRITWQIDPQTGYVRYNIFA